MNRPGQPAKWLRTRHHEFLGRLIADRLSRGGARLLLHAPPRHGKSELVSAKLPPWALQLWPEWRIQLASYEARFAATWGGKSKRFCLQHPELGVRLAKGERAADGSWETVEGGGLHTAGIGGPLTGRGANLLILDDPIKNAREAFSPVVRQAHWDWFDTTAMTRLEPGGSVIVMMTRWHQDDLVGRLLRAAQEGGEQWEFVCLPALAGPDDPMGREPGEPLWPERFDLETLLGMKASRGLLTWAAMFEGNPRAAGGTMFKREDFRIVEKGPIHATRLRSWDFAGTDPEKQEDPSDPDWTVGTKMAMDPEGNVYVEDVIRRRIAAGPKKRLVVQTATVDGKGVEVALQQDPGQAGIDQIAEYTRALRGFAVWSQPATGDKVLRADPYASQVAAGNVYLVQGPWNREFLDEHQDFPGSKFKDQVDSASWGYSRLAAAGRRLLDADPADEKARKKRDGWAELEGKRKPPADDDDDDWSDQ